MSFNSCSLRVRALLPNRSFFRLSSFFNLQKMASEELVTEQFQFLGIEIDREVLVKCEYKFKELIALE